MHFKYAYKDTTVHFKSPRFARRDVFYLFAMFHVTIARFSTTEYLNFEKYNYLANLPRFSLK